MVQMHRNRVPSAGVGIRLGVRTGLPKRNHHLGMLQKLQHLLIADGMKHLGGLKEQKHRVPHPVLEHGMQLLVMPHQGQ